MHRVFHIVGVSICICLTGGVNAGPIINAEESTVAIRVDAQMLRERFPLTTITTRTPWSRGELLTFRGALLLDVLQSVGLARTTSVELLAANGFAARIPLENIRLYRPVLATEKMCPVEPERDDRPPGKYVPLGVADFGPVFLVWPKGLVEKSVEANDYSSWVWSVVQVQGDVGSLDTPPRKS